MSDHELEIQWEIQSCPVPPPGAPQASPLHASLGGFAIFRTDDPMIQQKRKEHAETNANMGFYLEIEDFIAAFTPVSPSDNHSLPSSVKRKPSQMPETIMKIIKNARSERTVAEAWVSGPQPPQSHVLISSTIPGEVVEPGKEGFPRTMPWLPPRSVAGSLG